MILPPGFLKQELITAGLLNSNTCTSLNGHLTSEYFVPNLALMHDCLGELASFFHIPLILCINFKEAHNRVFLTKQAMKFFKNKSGFYASQTTSKFSGILLRQNVNGSVRIPPTQFIQAFMDSIVLNGQRLTLKTQCLLMPA